MEAASRQGLGISLNRVKTLRSGRFEQLSVLFEIIR